MSSDYSDMAFPKQSWKPKKKSKRKKVKSIMQIKSDRRCYLCMLLNNDYRIHNYLEEHHVIFGRGKRKISDEYGLLVNLCVMHHREGPEAVHNNHENAERLMKIAQKRFQETYTDKEWMEIVGKNYL